MGNLKMSQTIAGFTIMRELPAGFLECPATRLAEILPGPTLFDLPGRDPHPLFVSTLLHGNEDSGLAAMQDILRRRLAGGLSRSLLLFIGNVAAAAAGLRSLPGEMDHNRIWPGAPTTDDPLAAMARAVHDHVRARRPFAAVDIHNNTGVNPHYACVTRLEPQFISLARLFSRIVVHFQRPLGTAAAAFAGLCPSITVECGKSGAGSATQHAVELVEACLAISHLPDQPPPLHDVDLLRTFAIVKTPTDASLSFAGEPADFMFRNDIDHLNFSELAAGASFGRIGVPGARLEILPGESSEARPEAYFDYADGEIRLARPAIPAMLTRDPRAVRLDCLCYLMHRIDMNGARVD
jgi:hypothetical protein